MSGRPPSYVVGVDLGTTHVVVAAAPADGSCSPEVLPIPQPIDEARIEPRALLPSCLYAPLPGELTDPRALAPGGPFAFGAFARRRGAEITGRQITSAKSWLPSPHVDREAPILPWGERDDEEAPRISPVDASAAYLAVARRAWDDAHPDAPLVEQQIVLTVPASFDDAARALTLLAARRAGLSVELLEEPQAAFYEVLAGGAGAFAELDRALVLVCDVGGGTTDFSCLEVTDRGRAVRRVAVGDHLLLGGDNMDLALAALAERRLGGDRLDPPRFAALVEQARAAKERALSAGAPDELTLVLAGTGARLIGGGRRVTLARDEITSLVVDGFFPRVAADARPATGKGALVSFGLPYARDAAITRHLAAFLARAGGIAPTHLLPCGGVFHAPGLTARVAEVLSGWLGRGVTVLRGVDPDLAVARGAARHGLATRGHGVRIGGGSARAYYVLAPSPGGDTRAVCVLPQGSEPGVTHAIDVELSLSKGRAVRIDVAASSAHDTSAPGAVVAFDPAVHAPLPPLVARIEGRGEHAVTLEAGLSDLGTLALACVEPTGERHLLELELRPRPATASVAPPPASAPVDGRLPSAAALLDACYGREGRAAKDLPRELAKLLGERGAWPLSTLRALGDLALARAKGRRRDAEHERVFLNLTSYCLRPGAGHPDDAARMERFGPLLEEGVIHSRDPRVVEQWLIAARRVALGLDEARQQALFSRLLPALTATSTRSSRSPLSDHEPLVLELVAALERLPPATKEALGAQLIERVWTRKDPLLYRVIGRLGARLPAYASAHLVPRARVVEGWLDELRRERWEATPALAVAAADLARRTGDRARDLPDATREEVARRLDAAGRADLSALVREIVEARQDDREAAVGDALPPGLTFAS